MSESRHIIVARHPQTEQNAQGRYIGRGDSPLTETGVLQLRWLERAVRRWNPDAVLASPLGRALESARRLTPNGVELRVLDDLREIDFGDAEGHTYAELAEAGIRLDYDGGGPIAPNGETGGEFRARVLRAAAEVEHSGCRALVVTHGGVMRRLLVHWLDLPDSASWRFHVPNAALAVLRVCEGRAVLEQLTYPSIQSRPVPGRLGP